ncbi:MAG: cytidylate kinase family protein [Dehalococcoidia bacterium]|nr:MAG: cytidylate kinase family protein [Dehalococcoidia bacterium]
MAIITISRGSYSRGKEVAEKVAQRLGYECISRETILEASQLSHIPEIKLIRAIHDAPSILDRFTYHKEQYITYIQDALLRHVRKDNVVYHGLAGHFLLTGISHVLKVRIISDMDDRVKLEMEREGISKKEAMKVLSKDDEQRRKWSKYLYGIDTKDPSLYDLVIHVKKMTVDDAVDTICHAAGLKSFTTTPESQKAMDDLHLACEVKAQIIHLKPDMKVQADDGKILVEAKVHHSKEQDLVTKIREIAENIPGVKEVHVQTEWPAPYY